MGKNDSHAVLRRLYIATGLCCTFFIVEVIGGYLSGSLAVLSDAAHLFADLASFAIAIVASHLGTLPVTEMHTFGLKRAESLAALLSMLSLALVSIGLAVEAIRRVFHNESEVDGRLMSGVASIGVVVNVALAMVLGIEGHVHMPGADCSSHDHGGHDHSHSHHSGHDHHDKHDNHDGHEHQSSCNHKDVEDHGHCHGRSHSHHNHNESHDHEMTPLKPVENHHGHDHDHEDDHHGHEHKHQHPVIHHDEIPPQHTEKTSITSNVNLRAAYLHVMGDLAQSVGVLIAGVVIWFKPHWTLVDPICTLLFCAVVFYSTLGVLRSSVCVLLEEVPPNISWYGMMEAIQAIEGISDVHDLHIWSISQGHPSLSVHIILNEDSDEPLEILKNVYQVVKKRGVAHATIQIQPYKGGNCITCTDPDSPCADELYQRLASCSTHTS